MEMCSKYSFAAFMCAVTKFPVRKISIWLDSFLTKEQSPASPLASDLLLIYYNPNPINSAS